MTRIEFDAVRLLPREGPVEMAVREGESGVPALQRASKAWNPALATILHRHARVNRDWSHRFSTIAQSVGLSPDTLPPELRQLEA